MYDIGNSGSHSECTIHPVTVSVGSDSYRHVTEVTCDIGQSGSHSECTVLSVGSDPPRSCDKRSPKPPEMFYVAPFWRKCRGTLCSPCIMQPNVPKVLIAPDLRAPIWE